MSFQAMAWAIKQKLPTKEKFVLLILANYTDNESQCWPSIERLCEDTGMSRPTIKRSLRKLVELGYLMKVRRYRDKMQTSNLYRLKDPDSP